MKLSQNEFNLNHDLSFYQISPSQMSGCIAYWSCNEGTGSYVLDSVGGFTGSLFSGATFSEGRFGSGIQSITGNSMVKCGSNGVLDIGNNSSYTISLWINVGSPQVVGFPRVLEKGGFGGSGWSLQIGSGANLGQVQLYYGSGTGWGFSSNQINVILGIWANPIFLVSGGWCYGYLNSQITGSKAVSSPFYAANNKILNLNGQSLGGGAFQGKIDEVCLFNRSLTIGEMNILYQAGSIQGFNFYASNAKPNLESSQNQFVIKEVLNADI
mgnify:CR=1 FL=1